MQHVSVSRLRLTPHPTLIIISSQGVSRGSALAGGLQQQSRQVAVFQPDSNAVSSSEPHGGVGSDMSPALQQHYCTRAIRQPFIKAGLHEQSSQPATFDVYKNVLVCFKTCRTRSSKLSRFRNTARSYFRNTATVASAHSQATSSAMCAAVALRNKLVLPSGVGQERQRLFVLQPSPAPTAAAHAARSSVKTAAAGVHTVTLVLPGGKEAVFRAGSSKSIYDIASYAGVHLPASCK